MDNIVFGVFLVLSPPRVISHFGIGTEAVMILGILRKRVKNSLS